MEKEWWDDYFSALRELGIGPAEGKHVPSSVHDGDQTRCLVCGLWIRGIDMDRYNCPGRNR